MFRILFFIIFVGFAIAFFKVDFSNDLRSADRRSAQIAPTSREYLGPIVQVYEAREYKWKGLLCTHSWIAVKSSYSRQYTIYQVNRFYAGQDKPMIEIAEDIPDRYWYGNKPTLVCELRDSQAARAIKKIKKLVRDYPYMNQYEFFPGPNANTFTSYILNEVDELDGHLSSLALGKDYSEHFLSFSQTPSQTGYVVSIKGMFSFLFGKEEGFALSLCGLSLGLNPNKKELILPLVGTVQYSKED